MSDWIMYNLSILKISKINNNHVKNNANAVCAVSICHNSIFGGIVYYVRYIKTSFTVAFISPPYQKNSLDFYSFWAALLRFSNGFNFMKHQIFKKSQIHATM